MCFERYPKLWIPCMCLESHLTMCLIYISRSCGWSIHCGVEVTELSTKKQHTHSLFAIAHISENWVTSPHIIYRKDVIPPKCQVKVLLFIIYRIILTMYTCQYLVHKCVQSGKICTTLRILIFFYFDEAQKPHFIRVAERMISTTYINDVYQRIIRVNTLCIRGKSGAERLDAFYLTKQHL